MHTKKDTSDRLFTVGGLGHEKTHPELTDLMIAFAQASWSWTHAESCLFRLFAHAVEPHSNRHTKALRAAFFSVVSPLGRLDMINAVIASTCDKERIKHWSPIYLEYRKQIAIRGRLAHLAGHSYTPENGKPRAILMEPIYHPKTKRTHAEANSVEYTASHLRRLADKWGALSARVSVFILLVGEKDMLSESARVIVNLLESEADPSTRTDPTPPTQPPPSQP